MLTTILATPRSGSTTLWQSLGSEWWPDHHPLPVGYTEYYDGIGMPAQWKAKLSKEKYLENVKLQVTKNQLHQDLLEYSANNPEKTIVIKVIINQITVPMLQELLTHSDKIYHTVRKSYIDQLSSFVAAAVTDSWWLQKIPELDITQQMVDSCDRSLSQQILKHSEVYKQHGGDLVFLEDRFDPKQKYTQTVLRGVVNWPEFDTPAVFNTNHIKEWNY